MPIANNAPEFLHLMILNTALLDKVFERAILIKLMSKYAVLLVPILTVGLIKPLIIDGSFGADVVHQGAIVQNQFIVGQPFDSLLVQNSLSEDVFLDGSSSKLKAKEVVEALVTAYSSSPEETDETPFITASGSKVRFGVAAVNFLPLGAKIRLPKIFGDQIFVVEDRLHEKNSDRIDIWLPSKSEALEFGVKISELEIL